MQINSVRVSESGFLTVSYQELIKKDEQTGKELFDKVTNRRIEEKAVQELYDIFTKLKKHAIELIEVVSKDKEKKIKVTGFKFSYTKSGVMGGEMFIDVELANHKTGLKFKAPHKTVEPYNDNADDNAGVYNKDCAKLVEKLHDLVVKFINGERLERKLDL